MPFLLDILNRKILTLFDPRYWDDTNDSYFIEVYKKHEKLKSVLALCFAEASESYNHWKIYSGSSSGVCIEFEKDILLSSIGTVKGIKADNVKYKTISELNNNNLSISQLPFIKRQAFVDEQEFRIVYESKLEEIPTKDVQIDIYCISRIILNPWIPISVFDSVKEVISRIDGSNDITVVRTTLIDNELWKKLGKNKINSHQSTVDPKLI